MNEDTNKVILIPVDDIIPNRFQPRLNFNEKELQSLAESISEHGIVSPIIVRQIGDKYEIIAGERRFKAANLIGLNTVPCIVKNLDDTESAEVAVVENLQRANLTPIEEARSYDKLLAKGMTQEQLGKRLGVAQSTIANKIRLLNLAPYVQDMLLKNKISERHARSILQLPNFTMQKDICDRIIEERLTVKQTDEEINKLLGKESETTETDNNVSGGFEEEHVETLPEIDNMPEVEAPNVAFEALLRRDLPLPDANQKEAEEQKGLQLHEIPDLIDVNEIQKEAKEENEMRESGLNPFEKFNLPQDETINPFQTIAPKEETVETETFDMPVDPISSKGPKITSAVDFNTEATTPVKEEVEIKEESKEEPVVIENLKQANNFAPAIDSVRDLKHNLESKGYKIDTEEFDFEDMYQIVIKIKKD